jgi:hypothetical protein
MKMYGRVHAFLTSALDGGEWSASRPCCFTPGKTAPGTHCIGGWVGPKAGLDVMEKSKISCTYRESNADSSVVQTVAQSLYRLSYSDSLVCAYIYIYIYIYIYAHTHINDHAGKGFHFPKVTGQSTRKRMFQYFSARVRN